MVLPGVDLTLRPGSITAIQGESGIGKTTLLNILAGLVSPSCGHITGLEGRRVSMVFQEDRLLEWETALGNVLFVAGAKQEAKARALLTQVGLGDSVDKKAAHLSGGMKRRVAICRALMVPYRLLILDEPFKGLDESTRLQTIATVKAHLPEGAAVVYATHDMGDTFANDTVTLSRLKTGDVPQTTQTKS